MGRAAAFHLADEESSSPIQPNQPATELTRTRRREHVLLWTIALVFGLLMITLLAAMICSEITIHRGHESPVGEAEVPATAAYLVSH
jgi:hypothetical protein